MLTAQPGLGFWPVDDIIDTAKDVYHYAERAVGWVYDNLDEALAYVQKYGCTVVNNDIIVGVVAGGTSLVASPAAGGAVAAGAAAGQKGCRYISVSQAVLNQMKQKIPPAPPPPGVAPPAAPAMVYASAMLPVRPPNPAQPPAGRYKAGSMARFNTTRRVWSVYSPLAGVAGLGVASGGECLFGECDLGEAVEPPPPAGFVKTGEEGGPQPPAGTSNAGTERDRPFYKSPVVLALGGVVLLGGAAAAYLHFRKPARQLAGSGRRARRHLIKVRARRLRRLRAA